MIWSEADWEKDGYVNGRKTSINLCSFTRPHMRAFWYMNPAAIVCIFACPVCRSKEMSCTGHHLKRVLHTRLPHTSQML